MNFATRVRQQFSLAAALVALLTGCATEPEHPMPADYCNGGVLICVSANGSSEWERGEAFSCRCDYSGTLSESLDGNPGWVKRALAAKPQPSRRGTSEARARKAGKGPNTQN